MRIFDARGSNIEVLAFSPEGRFLVVGSYAGTLEMWEPTGGSATRFRVNGRVSRFAFHPRLPVAFAVIGGSFWILTHTEGVLTPQQELCPYTDRFALSSDGHAVVVSGRFDQSLNGHRLRMFEVRTDQTPLGWVDPPEGAGNLHWGLTWIPGTERFAVAEWAGHYPDYRAIITRRDAATGGIIEMCERSGLLNDDLVTSWDGTLIAMAKATISAWQQSDLTRPPHVIHNDNRKHFTGIAFHPSGKYLAATSNDATVKLYDTTTWKVARTFSWDIGKMRSIAFSPDGTLAAAGSDSGKVVVWDVDG